jgi:N-acetylmuramic acid 6-phosphate etherase
MDSLLNQLITEQVNENTKQIDRLPTVEVIRLINEEDRKVPEALSGLVPVIASAVDMIADAFRNGGRLFYIGAGTSGRLGILDASECPPTYGTDPSMVVGIIAGGDHAIRNAAEGKEDSPELGAQDIDAHGVKSGDVLVGIAASGRTPYVLGAMRRARQIGAKTIGLCNNYGTPMRECSDLIIEAVVGPEVVMGSTRMKAGTAQKMVLNMLTTASMIRIGKVYGNLMVDLLPTNEKLVHRAKRIIKLATEATEAEIEEAFRASGGHVKTAIVMLLAGTDAQTAKQLLDRGNGFVREAVAKANS